MLCINKRLYWTHGSHRRDGQSGTDRRHRGNGACGRAFAGQLCLLCELPVSPDPGFAHYPAARRTRSHWQHCPAERPTDLPGAGILSRELFRFSAVSPGQLYAGDAQLQRHFPLGDRRLLCYLHQRLQRHRRGHIHHPRSYQYHLFSQLFRFGRCHRRPNHPHLSQAPRDAVNGKTPTAYAVGVDGMFTPYG